MAPDQRTGRYVGNIQPVIPISLNPEWNLITRTIMPIINQPSLFPGMGSATGLGDINPTFFFSPAKPGELIWGVGPTFTLPTATDSLIGSGKFSLGPAAVALTMQGQWVFGALANNKWSVVGWAKENVNSLLLQPFVNYNLPNHWYLVSAPIMTANWAAAKAGDVWTVPLGGGFGKLFRLGDILPLEGHAIAKLQSCRSILNSRPSATWQSLSLAQIGSCASKCSCFFRYRRTGE